MPSADADTALDVGPWLKSRKMRKFMGKQDMLATIAAGLAIRDARLEEAWLKERTGVYMSVGYIPFERSDIEPIARASTKEGRFSMDLFSTAGFEQANPLLTFRCLPNMPIFHVSLNYGICGPYFVTYPGVGQFYVALEQAVTALRNGEVDAALVGAAADQANFLVRHHFARLPHSVNTVFADAGAFICLEKRSTAESRSATVKAELLDYAVHYEPFDPRESVVPFQEEINVSGKRKPADAMGYLGPTSLPVSLDCAHSAGEGGELQHSTQTMDGFRTASRWRLS
jgi:3-oxoacyl-(acyl-carrier-protein) synthase